jgi:hypothetical protein
MALSAKDVRFTTRRAGDGDPLLYPRLLKDRAILTSIDVALQYFETMVGEQRRALDPEALVHFFGDYKVARGMVASLGRTYRYRTPTVEEVVTRVAWRRLQRAGLTGPAASAGRGCSACWRGDTAFGLASSIGCWHSTRRSTPF